MRDSGKIYIQEGAEWFKSSDYGDDQDRVIKKADGSNTYLTADIAYHIDKLRRGYDRLINIWGADHHGYVARVKASIEALGYNPDGESDEKFNKIIKNLESIFVVVVGHILSVIHGKYIKIIIIFKVCLKIIKIGMKIRFIAIVATLLFSGILYGQSMFYDTWHGDINVQGQKLTIVFHISDIHSTMDVPSQGVFELPVKVKCENDYYVEVAMENLGAYFSGSMLMGNIVGQFTQYGVSFPLVLKRGDLKYNRPQTPVPPFEYSIEDVTFENPSEGAVLSGTLVTPCDANDSTPVVLMVSGSGLQDRNETLMQHSPFWVIADYFAKNGIATLRYDDRGFGKSSGPVEGMTTENNLADAEAGIAYLRGLDKFGKIGVLGHSEGGTVAFMMGANKSVDFVISLAGGAANGIDIIVGQNEAILQQQRVPQNIASDYATALRIIYKDRADGKEVVNKAEYVEDICKANDLVLIDNLKANLVEVITAGGEWFTWFIRYSPADAIRKIKCPVMALNGNLDLISP